MFLTTMIGVQTLCVGITTFLAYKSTKRVSPIKLVSKDKRTGFKHYKTGGF